MLEIRNLVVSFGDHAVLHNVQLSVERGEIVCLLGPSGCGKTTLLRAVAGLESPVSSEIIIDGQEVSHLPVHQRGFGLMFQDYALFPHMNVAQNVLFGLRMQNLPRSQQQSRLDAVLALVGLQQFADRDVSQLSGGERQRVALARSLAPNPRLLMLDEPLGALDASLRDRLVLELREIIKGIGLSAIYVTHDQQEAFAVADRIAVMNAGKIEQVAPPQTLYDHPETVFVAQFMGFSNIITVSDFDGQIAQTEHGKFPLPEAAEALLIHPDHITLERTERTDFALPGRVLNRTFQGDSYRLYVELHNGQVFRFGLPVIGTPVPEVGANIQLTFSKDAIIPLRA